MFQLLGLFGEQVDAFSVEIFIFVFGLGGGLLQKIGVEQQWFFLQKLDQFVSLLYLRF